MRADGLPEDMIAEAIRFTLDAWQLQRPSIVDQVMAFVASRSPSQAMH